MQVVDPHVHFWDPDEVPAAWLAHRGVGYAGDYAKLPIPFTPATLKSTSGDIEVVKCVHVEAITDDAVREVAWVDSLAQTTAMPIGIVAFADLSAGNFHAQLDALRASARLRGIRQVLGTHPNPMYAYAQHEYLRNPEWRRNILEFGKHGLLFDLQIYPAQTTDACEVIRNTPGVTFVLNHAGMFVDRNSVGGWHAWRDELQRLAALPNVVLKVSGLAMFDHQWTVESFRPYVLESIDAFGVDRCMFASNFPIDGLHSSYSSVWHAYQSIVSDMSAAEQQRMFCTNAERVYRL